MSHDNWVTGLAAAGAVVAKRLLPDLEVTVVRMQFVRWDGPFLGMSEDCNKRRGRVVGDEGELSCAEVEIVKRFRAAGWQAAWVQAFKCGRRRWGAYIAEPADLPEHVRRIQNAAGTDGGHPDVVAWTPSRVVFVESKGPGDSIKPNQVEWFARAVAAGQPVEDIGLVVWTAS